MSRIERNLTGVDIKIPKLTDDLADIQPGGVVLSPHVNGNLAEVKAYCSDICGPRRKKIEHLLVELCAREALLPDTNDKTAFVKRSRQIACIECAAGRMNGAPVMVVQRRPEFEA